jgi:hypothetical protein
MYGGTPAEKFEKPWVRGFNSYITDSLGIVLSPPFNPLKLKLINPSAWSAEPGSS